MKKKKKKFNCIFNKYVHKNMAPLTKNSYCLRLGIWLASKHTYSKAFFFIAITSPDPIFWLTFDDYYVKIHQQWYIHFIDIKFPYHFIKHGRFFLSHIYHPIPVFIGFILWKKWRRNTQCDNKNLSHEWLSHWYQGKYVIIAHTNFYFLSPSQFCAMTNLQDTKFLCRVFLSHLILGNRCVEYSF
jgi:hypothetical protein